MFTHDESIIIQNRSCLRHALWRTGYILDFLFGLGFNPLNGFFANARLNHQLVLFLREPHFDTKKFGVMLIEIYHLCLFRGYVQPQPFFQPFGNRNQRPLCAVLILTEYTKIIGISDNVHFF